MAIRAPDGANKFYGFLTLPLVFCGRGRFPSFEFIKTHRVDGYLVSSLVNSELMLVKRIQI